MSQYVSPKYAGLVAEYKAAQDASGENVWPGRDDAPYRIRAFAATRPAADDTE